MAVTLARIERVARGRTGPADAVFAFGIGIAIGYFCAMNQTSGVILQMPLLLLPRPVRVDDAHLLTIPLMRYSEDVAKKRSRQGSHGEQTILLHSRRILLFLKKDFHIANLAMSFLLRAPAAYNERRAATETAFLQAEALVRLLAENTRNALLVDPNPVSGVPRQFVRFPVLCPSAVRFARLIQDCDHIMEALLLVEYAKGISYEDRLLMCRRLIDAIVAVKTATIARVESTVLPQAQPGTDAPSPISL